MKIKLTESQYKFLLKEFTEVMVMCTPWKKCMDDPYGENEKTKWFIGRLDYNEYVDDWFPYSQDSSTYKTRDEATHAYYKGIYGKDPLMEMRFDGKSTGLFAEEEINEYFTDPYLTTDPENKWDRLEKDVESCITDIIETHKNDFGYDSYGVIDAVYQVMDRMFPKV